MRRLDFEPRYDVAAAKAPGQDSPCCRPELHHLMAAETTGEYDLRSCPYAAAFGAGVTVARGSLTILAYWIKGYQGVVNSGVGRSDRRRAGGVCSRHQTDVPQEEGRR